MASSSTREMIYHSDISRKLEVSQACLRRSVESIARESVAKGLTLC